MAAFSERMTENNDYNTHLMYNNLQQQRCHISTKRNRGEVYLIYFKPPRCVLLCVTHTYLKQ